MNQSTTALTLNMQLPNIATVSWAVQGDQLARRITATLVDGSTPWTPEASYHGVVRYLKPDGTSGVYDTDEDGNPAVTWSGNVATITIAQQALTFPGTVLMQLEFYDTNNARLTAFGWVNNVQPSAVTDTEFLSTDYYNILSLQIAAVLEVAGEMTPYSNTPKMDGTGAPGSSLLYSRGDHVHPTDTSRASKAELNTFVRPNLLYNWFFAGGGSQLGYGTFPINQRGLQTYIGAIEGIDRWSAANAAVTNVLGSDRMRLTLTSDVAGNTRLYQQVVPNAKLYRGIKLTLSVWVTAISGAFRFSIRSEGSSVDNPYVTVNSTGLYTVTGTVRSDADDLRVAVASDTNQSSGNYISMTAIKLEIGETQTLAHLEGTSVVLNELPNFADELARCKHFFERVKGNLCTFANGFCTTTTAVRAIFDTAVDAVDASTNPTVTLSGDLYIAYADHFGPSAVRVSALNPTNSVVRNGHVLLDIIGLVDLVPGQGCFVQFRDTSSYIDIKA